MSYTWIGRWLVKAVCWFVGLNGISIMLFPPQMAKPAQIFHYLWWIYAIEAVFFAAINWDALTQALNGSQQETFRIPSKDDEL